MNETARLCDVMHQFTNKVEYAYKDLLDKLEAQDDSNWSSESMAMIDMGNDARTLHQLADRIEGQRCKMMTRVHLVAAE